MDSSVTAELVTEALEGSQGAGNAVAEFFYKGVLGLAAEKGEMHIALWVLVIIACACLGYFLGSINFAVVISKLKFRDDVRSYGSGNAGATNMTRVYGKGAGIATLCGDILKTVLAVGIARLLVGDVFAYMTGMFCAIGHAYPCYYKFKGGKCVAVTAAMALVLEPAAFLFIFLMFALTVMTTKYVSLASIFGALMYPVVLYNIVAARFGGHGDMRIIFVTVTCLLVIFKHRENIKRLREGKENKFSFKKKEKKGKDA